MLTRSQGCQADLRFSRPSLGPDDSGTVIISFLRVQRRDGVVGHRAPRQRVLCSPATAHTSTLVTEAHCTERTCRRDSESEVRIEVRCHAHGERRRCDGKPTAWLRA